MPTKPPNPPTDNRPHPVIDPELCKGCERCVAACPAKVLRLREAPNLRGIRPAEYVGEGCTGCAFCHYTCPEMYAIEVHAPARRGQGRPPAGHRAGKPPAKPS